MKLRADSFAARLTPAQKEELFADLAGGKALSACAEKVFAWTKAEGWKRPSTSAISAWYQGAKVERRYAAAKEAALVAQANCPADYDEQARRALGQAKFLAVLEDLSPMDLAFLEKNEIAREKLKLDREKLERDVRLQKRDLALERAKLLLQRVKGGEKSADLQEQINLALDEIERMKKGED